MTIVAARLDDLVEVTAGYPFRGAVPNHPNGLVHVVQMRDLSADGVTWASTARADLGDVRNDYWLQPGDVLFVTRGEHCYARVLDEQVGDRAAVCGPHLLRLRVSAPEELHPEFLAWQLNQRPLQTQLDKVATGTAQRLIRKTDLQQLWIPLPSMLEQQRAIALQSAADRERTGLMRLVELRAAELAGVAEDFFVRADWPLL